MLVCFARGICNICLKNSELSGKLVIPTEWASENLTPTLKSKFDVVFSCKFVAYFQKTFPLDHFWRSASCNQLYELPQVEVSTDELLRNSREIVETLTIYSTFIKVLSLIKNCFARFNFAVQLFQHLSIYWWIDLCTHTKQHIWGHGNSYKEIHICLTIHTGKILCFTEFIQKFIEIQSWLLFHTFTQSITFF